MEGLTDKQEKFCQEYIIDLNATKAAIRAGYSEKTANRIASENLSKLDIQEYISKLKKEREERTQITSDMVVREFAKIAFVNPKVFYNQDGSIKSVHDLEDEDAATIQEISSTELKNKKGEVEATIFKYKLHSKIQALDALAKHTGAYLADNSQKTLPLSEYLAMTPEERTREIIKLKEKIQNGR